MGRASPALTSFNAGELSPLLEGRVDAAKYAAGAKVCENYIPLIQGPAQRRSGTRYIGSTKYPGAASWLVPFQFSASQAYMLEFGNGYVRFFTQQARLVVSGVSAYSAGTAYAVGDLASSGGVNYYCRKATTPGTPTSNIVYWYALQDDIYEIPSPFSLSDLTAADGTFALRFIESADVIYICAGAMAQQKLTRFGPTDWTMEALQAVGGPFKTMNLSDTTVQANGTFGTVTVTASAPIFEPGHVGSLFYVETDDLSITKPWEGYAVLASGTGANCLNKTCRSGNRNYTCTTDFAIVGAKGEIRTGTDRPEHVRGSAFDGRSEAVPNGPELAGVKWRFDGLTYGCMLITGYTSATVVTAEVVTMREGIIMGLPAGAITVATKRWAFGAWSDVEGWPTHVAVFRERLVFGRGTQLWLSTAAALEDFNPYDDNGLVTADAAITLRLPAQQQDGIAWMNVLSPTVEALMVGTASEEFAVKSQTENQAFGTDNVTAQPISAIGARAVQPVKIGPALLFVQRLGTKLRDLTFDAGGGGSGSNDQTLYAEHIPRPKLDQLAFQQDPYSTIWAKRSDGALVAMTYSREQYADPPHGGWHRHPTDGTIQAIATMQGADRTELWLIVSRDGQRFVELLEAPFTDDDALEDAFFVDCGLSYSGAPATTFTNLWHIEGKEAAICADGAALDRQAVTGGSITIEEAASAVHIGLPMVSRLQTMRLNAGGQDGTSQGKKSRIPQGVVRLQNTMGLKIGASFDSMDELDFRTGADDMDEAIPLFTGDKAFNWPEAEDGYNTNPWLCFEQSDPLPGTIVAVFPQVIASDKG